MKKISILFSFLFITTIVTAQFTVEDYDGVPILDGDVRVFNSLEPTGTPGVNESVLYFWINNPSTEDEIFMKIKLESITNADGSSYQFCFGDLCIFDVNEGQTYPVSGVPETIPPGGTNLPENKFQNDNPGDGTNYPVDYVWKFFEVDADDNEIGTPLTFTYRFDPNLSVNDLENNLGVKLQNTIAGEELNVQSKHNLNFEIFNLNGQLIRSNQVEPGLNSISTASLNTGMYFIKFSNNNGTATTLKFVVK
jgi:hypothetical protein